MNMEFCYQLGSGKKHEKVQSHMYLSYMDTYMDTYLVWIAKGTFRLTAPEEPNNLEFLFQNFMRVY